MKDLQEEGGKDKERADYLTSLVFQINSFKITFLREIEIAVMLK